MFSDELAATIVVGGDDLVRVWVNGRLVHETTSSSADYRDLDRVRVKLGKGYNTILAKISNASGAHIT